MLASAGNSKSTSQVSQSENRCQQTPVLSSHPVPYTYMPTPTHKICQLVTVLSNGILKPARAFLACRPLHFALHLENCLAGPDFVLRMGLSEVRNVFKRW